MRKYALLFFLAGAGNRRCFLFPLLAACLFTFSPAPLHAAPVSILDDSGAKILLPAPARRVLPLYAGLSEIIVGLDKADTIIARTASDTVVSDTLPNVGTHMRPNFELAASLRPDLILIFEGRKEAALTAEKFSDLGIPAARFRISSFDELFSCMERIGVLLGVEETAQQRVRHIRNELDAMREEDNHALRPKVFFEVRYPNLLGAGGGHMLADIADAAGTDCVLASYPERMVRLSEETLITFAPHIYIVLEGPMNSAPIPPDQRPHYRNLPAVRGGWTFTLPEQEFSRPGPQSLEAAKRLRLIAAEWRKAQLPPKKKPSPQP